MTESLPPKRLQSVAELIAELVNGLKGQPKADVELVEILEKYILTDRPPNDAVDQAITEIGSVAEARTRSRDKCSEKNHD